MRGVGATQIVGVTGKLMIGVFFLEFVIDLLFEIVLVGLEMILVGFEIILIGIEMILVGFKII